MRLTKGSKCSKGTELNFCRILRKVALKGSAAAKLSLVTTAHPLLTPSTMNGSFLAS